MFVRACAGVMMTASVAIAQPAYQYVEIPLLPGTVRSAALGVNNLGQTVGWCRASDNQYYGFLYDHEDGSVENLGTLGISAGGYEPGAHDINDETEIVGVFGVNQAGGVRSFFWSEGAFSNISYLPRAGVVLNSAAFGINAFGEVVGINSLLCADGFSVATAAALWPDPTDPQTPPIGVIGTPVPVRHRRARVRREQSGRDLRLGEPRGQRHDLADRHRGFGHCPLILASDRPRGSAGHQQRGLRGAGARRTDRRSARRRARAIGFRAGRSSGSIASPPRALSAVRRR